MLRVLAAAAAPLLLVACGGSPSRPAGQAAQRALVASTWHRYVQCVRDHGVAGMPDPSVDDRGRVTFPPDAPRVPDDVVQQCSPILDALPPQPAARVEVATRIEFAQCMRQQGIGDFPDPDSQGRFHLPPSMDQGGGLKSSPRWPQVQAAMDGPCRRYDPSGGI